MLVVGRTFDGVSPTHEPQTRFQSHLIPIFQVRFIFFPFLNKDWIFLLFSSLLHRELSIHSSLSQDSNRPIPFFVPFPLLSICRGRSCRSFLKCALLGSSWCSYRRAWPGTLLGSRSDPILPNPKTMCRRRRRKY